MRRLVILILLSALMVGIDWYDVGASGDVAPKSLAAFGFVLLAAFIIGELAAVVKLPRVTGYLLAGVAFGPDAADFFGRAEVADLSLINSLAVGLIALTAGGELKMSELKANIRGISTIILVQVLIIFPLITAVFVFSARHVIDWGALGVEPSTALLLAIGTMLGALAVGNSPAVSVAIVTDTRSSGPLTRMNLGVTITKDLVVVILFSVITGIQISLLSPGGEDFSTTLILLGEELGKSILTGFFIAAVLWAYLRWVGEELLLFLVGLIFLGMFVADFWHLEKILVFIVAGFLVENFSQRGDDMIHAIERVSPPVYVVFFAVAGAGLELGIIRQMLVVAVLLVAVRIVGMLSATWLGARFAGLGPLFQKKLGIGFFSQAGVTLGLVIIATEKLDKVVIPGSDLLVGSELFGPIILGVVALNLLMGPVFLKWSLSAAKETGAQQDEAQAASTAPAEQKVECTVCQPLYPNNPGLPDPRKLRRASAAFPPPPPLPPVPFDTPQLGPELTHALEHVRTDLETAIEDLRWEFVELRRSDSRLVIERLRDHTRFVLSDVLSRIANISDVDAQRQWIRRARVALAEAFYATLREERAEEVDSTADDAAFDAFFRTLMAAPDHVPKAIAVNQTDELYAPSPNDGIVITARKSLSRLRRRFTSHGERVVPVRRMVEFFVSGPMPAEMVGPTNMAGYQRFYFWRKVNLLTRYIDGQICGILRLLSDPILIEPTSAAAEGSELTLLPLQPATVDGDLEEPRRRAIAREKLSSQVMQQLELLAATAEEDFDLVLRDLDAFADELAARVRGTVAHGFGELVDACRIAGTYQLSDRSINTSKVYDRNKEGRDDVEEALSRWRLASLGFSGRLLAVLDIIDLQHVAFGRVAEAKIEVANALLNELRPVPIFVAHHLENALETIREHLTPDVDPATAIAVVENLRTELAEEVTSSAIGRLEISRDRGKFMDLLESFSARLGEDATELTHSYEVTSAAFEHLDEGSTPPPIRLAHLPLRELARELLGGEVAVKLAGVNTIINRTVDQSLSGLSDIQRVVSFNLDAAAAEVQNFAQNPETNDALELAKEFALGGLQRSLTRLQELIEHIDQTERQVGSIIQYETYQQLQRLRRMAVEGDISQIDSYLKQRTIEGRAAETVSGLRGRLKRGTQRLNDIRSRHVQPIAHHLRRQLRRRLGLTAPITTPLVEHTDEAHFAAVQNEAIPATYRRLFTTIPVELEEFFVGRQAETTVVRTAFERFMRGLPSNVLVAGTSGAGTTSFVDHTLRVVGTDLHVERMAFSHNLQSERQLAVALGNLLGEPTRDLSRLRARLRNAKLRRIVVIEGLHNLYLRTIDGFSVLEKFLLLVSETSSSFFWIITTNADTLRQVGHVLPLSDYLTHKVELAPLTPPEVQRLIEARHGVSGYDLRFLTREDNWGPGAWPWSTPRQDLLQAGFYEDLARHSHGNTTLALFYWLRALRAVTDDTTIDVAPVTPLDTRFIAELEMEKLMALAALITHGGLSLEDFTRVFRIPRIGAEALLRGLLHLSLVDIEPGRADTYHVNPVLFPNIASVLRRRHIL